MKLGGYISLYITGQGRNATAAAGTPPRPVLPVSVTIDGIQAPVQYQPSAAGQLSGLLQITVQVPIGVKAGGYVPIAVRVGDASTTAGAVWISVAEK